MGNGLLSFVFWYALSFSELNSDFAWFGSQHLPCSGCLATWMLQSAICWAISLKPNGFHAELSAWVTVSDSFVVAYSVCRDRGIKKIPDITWTLPTTLWNRLSAWHSEGCWMPVNYSDVVWNIRLNLTLKLKIGNACIGCPDETSSWRQARRSSVSPPPTVPFLLIAW